MARRAYRRFSKEFKLEAIRLAEESGKPKAQVAREPGIRVNQTGNEIHRLEDDVHGRTNAAGAGCAGAAKWVVPSRYGVFSS